MTASSSRARSCCNNRYLVTLTFAPLERNRGSRAQTPKNSMVFVNFCPGPRHDRQAASDAADVYMTPARDPKQAFFLPFWRIFGRNGRGMPGGRFSRPGDHSGPISDHFRRFRARPNICDLNIMTLPQLKLLRHQHCVLRQDRCLRNLNCGNITMFKSRISGLALNRRKWSEMGPEWSPGPENWSSGMLRPFSRLWDRSRGPKPPTYSPNSRSTAPGGHYWYRSSWDLC